MSSSSRMAKSRVSTDSPETVPDTENHVALSQAGRTGEGEGVGAAVGAGIGSAVGVSVSHALHVTRQACSALVPSSSLYLDLQNFEGFLATQSQSLPLFPL